MFRERCQLIKNEQVAPGHWVMTLSSSKIARKAQPGQFVQILCEDSYDPLLPRPFSFLDTTEKSFTILYHVVGRGTDLLARSKKGAQFHVMGPSGKGFTFPSGKKEARDGLFLLVGGGVGIPPLHHFAKELLTKKVPAKNIHVFLGARDKSLLLCEKEFKKLKVILHLATDNGSRGARGYVTGILEDFLSVRQPDQSAKIFTCGPTPMMKAATVVASRFSVPCEVSVEVPMACGFGACLGCAVKVKDGASGHRFAIACCEGPVFKGEVLTWD